MYQMNMVPKGFLYTSVLSMYWEGKNVQIIWQKKMKKYIYVHFLVWVYLFIFWFIPYTLHIPRNNCDAYLVTYYYYILIRLYIWSFDWFQMTSEKYKYVVDEWSRKKNIYLLLFPDVRFFYQSFWFEKNRGCGMPNYGTYSIYKLEAKINSVKFIYIPVFHEFLNPE